MHLVNHTSKNFYSVYSTEAAERSEVQNLSNLNSKLQARRSETMQAFALQRWLGEVHHVPVVFHALTELSVFSTTHCISIVKRK